MAREITDNNFEISLVVFMPNITTNHAITYTNKSIFNGEKYISEVTLKCQETINRKVQSCIQIKEKKLKT